ncbi:hypothetical protein [Streptomyces sp. NPDC101237]
MTGRGGGTDRTGGTEVVTSQDGHAALAMADDTGVGAVGDRPAS